MGESDNPTSPNLLEAISAALANGLVRLIPGNGQVDIIAFSFGTVVGGALAAQMLRTSQVNCHVRRLALCAPAGIGVSPGRFSGLKKLEPGMSKSDRLAVHGHNLERVMLADPAAIDDLAVRIQDANVAAARASGRPYSQSTIVKDVLAKRPVEAVAAVWGSRDAYALPDRHAYEAAVAALDPNLHMRRVEGAGHWVLYERPREVNDLLKDFLNHKIG